MGIPVRSLASGNAGEWPQPVALTYKGATKKWPLKNRERKKGKELSKRKKGIGLGTKGSLPPGSVLLPHVPPITDSGMVSVSFYNVVF